MKKERLITVGLIIATLFLIGSIFYFSYLLMQTPTDNLNSSKIAPKKTKAQIATSEKFIALNQSGNPSPTQSFLPTEIPSPTLDEMITPTPIIVTSTETEEIISPTPTEIILAKSISPSSSLTNHQYLSPTETENLPSSGYLNNVLVVFGVAVIFIFYSLLF